MAIYVGSLAGLLPCGPGHSLQSVRVISALGSVPTLLMAEPAAEAEVHALLNYLVNDATESSYLRLVSVKWPLPFAYPTNARVQPGRGWIVRPGADAVVFGYGPWLLSNAWHAAEEIEKTAGSSLRIVNLPWLNRVDAAWLKEAIGACRTIITLDNHYLRGGQGEMLGAAIAELGLDPAARVSRIGVAELPECGTNDEVLAHHGLDVAGLVKQFTAAIGQHTFFNDVHDPAHDSVLGHRRNAAHHRKGRRARLVSGSSRDHGGDVSTVVDSRAGADRLPDRRAHLRAAGRPHHRRCAHADGDGGAEEMLPSTLPSKQGRVLPNVREILESLRGRADVHSYLLTGNTRAGACAKLTHYDLFQYFPDGAFAEDQGSRSSIAARALDLARRGGTVETDRIFVIGDTPHDIECATSIDARTIAVATGGYTFEELMEHHPWRVFAELPPPS